MNQSSPATGMADSIVKDREAHAVKVGDYGRRELEIYRTRSPIPKETLLRTQRRRRREDCR